MSKLSKRSAFRRCLLSKTCRLSGGLKVKLVLTETEVLEHGSGRGCLVSCQSHFLNNPTLPALKPPTTPSFFSALRFHASAYQTHPPIHIPPQTPPPSSPQLFPGTFARRDSPLYFVLRLLANLPSTAGDGVHCVINTWRYSCCPRCPISVPSSG